MYIKSSFIWAQHFGLYLSSQRSDIDPLDAFMLGYQYVEMLPNLINVDPESVVNEYLHGYDGGRII